MPKFGETSSLFSEKDRITHKLIAFNDVDKFQLEISENKEFTSFYEIQETRECDKATLIIRCGEYKFSISGIKS